MPKRAEAPKWATVERSRTNPEVVALIAALEPGPKAKVKRLRSLIRAELPRVKEGIYWGVPFYFLAGPAMYISPAKNHVTLGFTRGQDINDPSGLLVGTGATAIRKAAFRLDAELPEQHIHHWIREAARLDVRHVDDPPDFE